MNRFPSNRAACRKVNHAVTHLYPGEAIRREPTLDLVAMSPEQFIRMENWGKRKRKAIRLAQVSILKD